ncbi:MAG: PhoH family protein [Proteobacteria bacterium]|nr:PhoH family protein [Pseudomonadota bacterium]MBI3499039.1 PhoH family protein [Pseudomonadota bacterium]
MTRQDPIRREFGDNSLLPILFGEHDRHLARIEQSFDVSIASRGNVVAITGPEGSARAADATLKALYDRLAEHKRGGAAPPELEASVVDAAILWAGQGGQGEAASGNGEGFEEAGAAVQTWKRPIIARSPVQADYIHALRRFELVFGLGPAGTGKTYLAVAVAVAFLREKRVDRIILSRPAVEAGERLGFLPGDMKEKIDPYLRPLYDALYDMMPGEQVDRRLKSGEIEIAPLAFMRGRTLANSFIILDEAQNTTPTQMKMFLTRLGENSRMSVTGDPSQIDLPLGARSGLNDALETLKGVTGVTVTEFTDADVVRHPLVTRIVRAYNAKDPRLLAAKAKEEHR